MRIQGIDDWVVLQLIFFTIAVILPVVRHLSVYSQSGVIQRKGVPLRFL
jgi:hypothetical protein